MAKLITILVQNHILFSVDIKCKTANKKNQFIFILSRAKPLFCIRNLSQDGRGKQACNAFLNVSYDVYIFFSSFSFLNGFNS